MYGPVPLTQQRGSSGASQVTFLLSASNFPSQAAVTEMDSDNVKPVFSLMNFFFYSGFLGGLISLDFFFLW